MKKLLSLLLAAMLSATMVACQNDPAAGQKELTPYEVFVKTNETSESYSSMEMNMGMVAGISVGGESMDINMDGVVRQIIRSETDMDMEMLLDMEMMGMTIETKTYYKDGYMYQDMMGTRQKIQMPIAEMRQQMENASSISNLDIPEEAVKDIVMSRTEDNGYSLSFDLDAAYMDEAIDQVMASMGDVMGQMDANMNISDIKYELTADENYNMKSADMEFSMDMEIQGETAAMDVTISMEALSVNSLDKIEFPDDLDTYPTAA